MHDKDFFFYIPNEIPILYPFMMGFIDPRAAANSSGCYFLKNTGKRDTNLGTVAESYYLYISVTVYRTCKK